MFSKKIPFAAYFLSLFALAFVATSCDNRCATINCRNGAECDKGQCYCSVGYEGVECEKQWADKFLGSFTTVNAADCNRVFSSDITQTDRLKLKIRNLGGFIGMNGCVDYGVTATLKSRTTFEVDDTFCNNFRITAKGVYNDASKKLTVDYNCTRDSLATYACRAVYQY